MHEVDQCAGVRSENSRVLTKPTVSIITPSFNREDLVAETLDSIAAQSYPYWESVVVDDGSSDRTKEIIGAYAARDPRFRLLDRTGTPKGACTCRNEGVGVAIGKYVLCLDTDDIIEPFCLDQRVRVMEAHPYLDFAIFPGLMFETTPHDLGLWWNIDKAEDELARLFKQDAICQGSGVLWRKDSFVRIGMWDQSLMLWQDIDLFFRAYIQGYRYAKFFDLPPDLHNRVNPTSLSRSAFHAPLKTKSRCDVVKRAVQLLCDNGLAHRASEARYMTAEIVSGAARSGQYEVARQMLNWALSAGVLTSSERRRLGSAVILRKLRASRLGAGRLVAWLESGFASDSTLGRLPVGDSARQAA